MVLPIYILLPGSVPFRQKIHFYFFGFVAGEVVNLTLMHGNSTANLSNNDTITAPTPTSLHSHIVASRFSSTFDLIRCRRVSSVLNKDVRAYGKQNLFDGSEETCWNSDAGAGQFIQLEFDAKVELHRIGIMFQGGFGAKVLHVQQQVNGAWHLIQEFHPLDINTLQYFDLPTLPIIGKVVKLTMPVGCDFYGRITIYRLLLEGKALVE